MSASMVLACVVDSGTSPEELRGWADLVAPQVSLRPIRADLADTGRFAGDTPYALLGSGSLGTAAFELAGRLTEAGCGPTRLLVCGCPPPVGAVPLRCPIVAFAGSELADEMADWRAASTAGFTLRLLEGFEAPPRGRATPDISLALKEELQVWPY